MALSEVAPKVHLPKLAQLATSATYCLKGKGDHICDWKFGKCPSSLVRQSTTFPTTDLSPSSQANKEEGEPSLVCPLEWHCHWDNGQCPRYESRLLQNTSHNSLQWLSPCTLPKTLKNTHCIYYFNASNVYEIRGCTKRNIMVMLLSLSEESKAA